jgi:hypothetical protein
MTLENGNQKEDGDRAFYFALYVSLAHWGAFIAILILLITIGMLLSTSQITGKVAHPNSAVAILCALWFGEVYLIVRIVQLGKGLKPTFSRGLELIPVPYNQIIPFLAATGAVIWDVLLVLAKL